MSSPKMKKAKKYAALDKQHSDAERSQRGRRRKSDGNRLELFPGSFKVIQKTDKLFRPIREPSPD